MKIAGEPNISVISEYYLELDVLQVTRNNARKIRAYTDKYEKEDRVRER